MITHKLNCPRCGTTSVALQEQDQHSLVTTGFQQRGRAYEDVFVVCGYCHRGVVLTFERDSRSNNRGAFRDIAPSPPSFKAPESTPDNTARFFAQATESVFISNWDAAGAMFRKAIETALKHKFPDLSGTLNQRIQKATDKHDLTPEMAQWAHHVRLGGNEAAHEEEPFSEEAALELGAFTKLMLIYWFRLPGMITASRNKSQRGRDE